MIFRKLIGYIKDPLKYLILCFLKIPFNYDHYELLELRAAKAQGKGFGSATIQTEVKSCLKLIGFRPQNFIDIGANKGKFTKEVLKYLPNIECHLFEPSKINLQILKEEFSRNKNINIQNYGLFNKNTFKEFYSDYPGSGLGSLSKRRLDHHDIEFKFDNKIELKRFDEYWLEIYPNENKEIDFVKIDVEGYEMEVLEGFGKLIKRAKLIQFEFGTPAIDSRMFFQDFWYFFLKRNFELYRLTPNKDLTYKINSYSELHEFFITTNYIAINKETDF
ncbi:MAG: FkbM family methyltransferase [Euryarchaeota archaeon]|nr:FkbM family methyltransferase [Euryarchaeota archaeon]|tara:strand:- start:26946 stop:27773 length:828 start_codon:yes stop_codon:yes gene_type:complete